MINLIIVGIGDLATTKLIPAAKELQTVGQIVKLIFVDIRPIDKILDSLKTNKFYSWLKSQEIFQDDSDTHFLDKISESVTSNDAKTVVYLATPPRSFQSCVIKYNKIAHVFVLEKPWAENSNDLEQTLKSAHGKKIIGVDHYLWKDSVRQFLMNRNIQTISKSRSFDFVLTEKLPEPERKYYWDYGEVADMMPHVLPLLDKLFSMGSTIVDSDSLKFRCASWNPDDPNYRDKNSPRIIKRETFIEIESTLENKVIHVILGKGMKYYFDEQYNKSKFFSNNMELLIDFEEKNDAYNNILCYLSKNIDKIDKGQSSEFLDPESMRRYISKIDLLQKKIDKKYGLDKREFRSIALQEHPDLIYCKNKGLTLQFHKANNCVVKDSNEKFK